ncbi:MAG TPA: hypothetical protein DEE98_02195 [Elusimicrobia bacterium]|nr:MAG: hypothetical protein A2278_08315 [Elusimicrobia bacterium RIFOXYA12_FULL_49_49]OGS15931.1 MAG: hypothetical protein A2251_01950 [Elusimicrobia bacterium RIFOXYA2_FULL_47_53]OGS26387.1 MAG: hypothetical protein A2339_03320 [Elusimicrobia bacterium RIFOXYB12_FULL_50_12]OGS29099.1 MAG: hypothetical protein A2323_04490 [Elusimicrobia bacterium RIFOXYB2_FULL_46_23]HBU69173.1 hypothetical protein [Elusimicrobiota bacterium]
MIKINLLPPESIKKEERKEIFILAYGVLAIFVLIGLVKYGFKLSFYNSIQTRTAAAEQELGKYESIVKQVDALQATKTGLETKKNVISSLMADRLVYPVFMQKVMELLPSNVWFKSLSTNMSPGGLINVTLEADALDNYGIADLITALSTDGNFSGVELGPINTNTSAKTQTSSFRLTFSYKAIKP